MEEFLFTEKQLEIIKDAFWKEFHESGEIFFNYLGSKEENEECTNSYWESFKDNLLIKRG